MIQILLDECVPVKLKYRFQERSPDFVVSTVTDEAWTGIKNGKLLSLAQQQFDIFVTIDQNLFHQQELANYTIAVILLQAKSNRYTDLLSFVDSAIETFMKAEAGHLYRVATHVE